MANHHFLRDLDQRAVTYTKIATSANSSADNVSNIATGRQPYAVRLRQGSVSPIATIAVTRQKRDSGAAIALNSRGTTPNRFASAKIAKQTRNHGGRGTALACSEMLWVHAVNNS